MIAHTLIVAAALCSQAPPETVVGRGVISGVVLNASQGDKPVPLAEVVLRARPIAKDGQVITGSQGLGSQGLGSQGLGSQGQGAQATVAATTIADANGRFTFSRLPTEPFLAYTPGANRSGIHYPGPTVRLSADRPTALATLSVCDTIGEPSPLRVKRHVIVLTPKADALEVTESLVVENPSNTCYVGPAVAEGNEPITFSLSIPQEFQRVTFDKEFFGRRFVVHNGKLVTGIPWTPGQREVKLTYVVPNRQRQLRFARPMDLPCQELVVSVLHDDAQGVKCNLARRRPSGDESAANAVEFASAGAELPAGHVVELTIGRAPLSAMAYARYAALAIVAVLLGGGIWLIRRSGPRPADATTAPSAVDLRKRPARKSSRKAA